MLMSTPLLAIGLTAILIRVCIGETMSIPKTPTDLELKMSSVGRIFVAWSETPGAKYYRFKSTLDGHDLSVNPQIKTQNNSMVGAVAYLTGNPYDLEIQGKMVCLAVQAVNAFGSSAFTSLQCTEFRWFVFTDQASNLAKPNDHRPTIWINR